MVAEGDPAAGGGNMSHALTKRKNGKRDVLAGSTPDLQLYRGVRRYVQHLGGSVVVIGGIEVQEWPSDGAGMYRVAVRVVGRKPTRAACQRKEKPQ